MNNLIISKISVIFLTLVLGAFALTAQAHEARNLGDGYIIEVGNSSEPPTTGPNQADFLAYYGDFNDPDTWVPISRTGGNKVEVAGVAVNFATDSYNAPITQILFPILYQFSPADIEGTPAYRSNVFNEPTAGAYGFLLAGKLKKAGHPEKVFAVKFVCGGGSQDTTYGSNFECIE